MRWNTLKVLTSLCVAVLILSAPGCPSTSPEEQIVKIRDGYTIELNSWSAQEPEEAAVEEMAEAAEAATAVAASAAAVASEEGAAEEEMPMDEEEVESGPQPKNILFDLVVLFRGRKALNDITVDVTHADADQQKKAVYQQWIDTAGMGNGETRQVDFVLEGLEVEEGDAFSVLLREVVPPEERGKYREFSEPTP